MAHLFLDINKVDPVEIGQHLRDLSGVLQYGAGRLRQMVEGRVAAQRLGEGGDGGQLHLHHAGRRALRGRAQPALQRLGEVTDHLRQRA